MMSEQAKEKRNKWYRDNVKKYCVCVNIKDVEIIDITMQIITILDILVFSILNMLL